MSGCPLCGCSRWFRWAGCDTDFHADPLDGNTRSTTMAAARMNASGGGAASTARPLANTCYRGVDEMDATASPATVHESPARSGPAR